MRSGETPLHSGLEPVENFVTCPVRPVDKPDRSVPAGRNHMSNRWNYGEKQRKNREISENSLKRLQAWNRSGAHVKDTHLTESFIENLRTKGWKNMFWEFCFTHSFRKNLTPQFYAHKQGEQRRLKIFLTGDFPFFTGPVDFLNRSCPVRYRFTGPFPALVALRMVPQRWRDSVFLCVSVFPTSRRCIINSC